MPITISGSTGIAGVNGSAGVPTVQGATANNGVLFPAANTVALATAGSERMRIDSSGNMGIGTSSPGQALGISRSGTAELRLTKTAGTSQYIDIGTGGGGDNHYIYGYGNYPLIFATNGSERARITSTGDFQFNSGYGSVATAYGCRAWVNFNGTGVVAIRASGSVSSITDNGTGNYTVNFSITLPDANYSAVTQASRDNNNGYSGFGAHGAADGQTTTSCVIYTGYESGSSSFNFDPPRVNLAVFR